MDELVVQRVDAAMALTNGLADGLAAADLDRRLIGLPSNSIGSQFWCVVGARESYARGIETGGWRGFSCSLTRAQTKQPGAITAALAQSKTRVLDAIAAPADAPPVVELIYDLWEHESQHQGQLIRYFYANGLAFPDAFASRYALEQPAATASEA
jgi:hypothetical protein